MAKVNSNPVGEGAASDVVACCHLHQEVGCCDPEDCGPCCENCPTCPTINGTPPPPWDHAIWRRLPVGWLSCPTCHEKCAIRARPPMGSVDGPKVVMVCEVDACTCGWPGSGVVPDMPSFARGPEDWSKKGTGEQGESVVATALTDDFRDEAPI